MDDIPICHHASQKLKLFDLTFSEALQTLYLLKMKGHRFQLSFAFLVLLLFEKEIAVL